MMMASDETLIERLNRNIPLITLTFILFSTIFTLTFLICFLGARHIGSLVFVNNTDIVRTFVNTSPFTMFLISIGIAISVISDNIRKSESRVKKHVGNNIIPLVYLFLPPTIFVFFNRIWLGGFTQSAVISAVYLLAILFITLFISVGAVGRDVHIEPSARVFLVLMFCVPFYALSGFFFSSLQSTLYLPCYDVILKEPINGKKEIESTHLVISLDRGMAFDDGTSQYFVSADGIVLLRAVTCKMSARP